MTENLKALQQYKTMVTERFLNTEIQPLVEHILLATSSITTTENDPKTHNNNNNNNNRDCDGL